MTDVIQWACLDSVSSPVSCLKWPELSYMYLERVPNIWLDESERQSGLRLAKLDPNTPFDNWERGRIFCNAFELRWEKLDGKYQIVYVGPAIDMPNFQAATEEIDLAAASPKSHSYFLWGSRVVDEKLETIGASKEAEAEIFVEMRVPRLLHYPVSHKASRVKLTVCEYVDPETGAMVYYRFQGLEEV